MYWAEYVEQKPINHLCAETGIKTTADRRHFMRGRDSYNGDVRGFRHTAMPEADFLKFYLNVSAVLMDFKKFLKIHPYSFRLEFYVYRNKIFAVHMILI